MRYRFLAATVCLAATIIGFLLGVAGCEALQIVIIATTVTACQIIWPGSCDPREPGGVVIEKTDPVVYNQSREVYLRVFEYVFSDSVRYIPGSNVAPLDYSWFVGNRARLAAQVRSNMWHDAVNLVVPFGWEIAGVPQRFSDNLVLDWKSPSRWAPSGTSVDEILNDAYNTAMSYDPPGEMTFHDLVVAATGGNTSFVSARQTLKWDSVIVHAFAKALRERGYRFSSGMPRMTNDHRRDVDFLLLHVWEDDDEGSLGEAVTVISHEERAGVRYEIWENVGIAVIYTNMLRYDISRRLPNVEYLLNCGDAYREDVDVPAWGAPVHEDFYNVFVRLHEILHCIGVRHCNPGSDECSGLLAAYCNHGETTGICAMWGYSDLNGLDNRYSDKVGYGHWVHLRDTLEWGVVLNDFQRVEFAD